MSRRVRFGVAALTAAAAAAVLAPVAATASQGGRPVDDVRAATAQYFDVANATGYGELHDAADIACLDDPTGGMGIHFVNGGLVSDSEVDATRPELLVYDPSPDGSLDLVAVEYVVFADVWHAAHGTQPPKLFGRKFEHVAAGNRYGLPPFYELHLWAWKPNPNGLFADFNPNVVCE